MIRLHKTRLAFGARRVVWVTQVRVSHSRMKVDYSRSCLLYSRLDAVYSRTALIYSVLNISLSIQLVLFRLARFRVFRPIDQGKYSKLEHKGDPPFGCTL